MDCDLVLEFSPLFLLKSEEKHCSSNNNKTQVNTEETQSSFFCSSDADDHGVSHQDVFSTETSLLTPDWVDEGSVSKSDRNNNTKQESTRILDIIKYSPKFLRKKNPKQVCRSVSPSVEESKGDLHDELNQKCPENLENSGSASPKLGLRKKLLLSVNSRDTEATETVKIALTIATKTAMPDQENTDLGSPKGSKNWRKVKAALKRMNDNGVDQFKPVIANSEENIQAAAKLPFKLSPEQVQDDDESDEDVYQRFKAFLNSSEKKLKTPRSPRLQLRSKFSFWPKGGEAGGVPYTATPAIQEENGIIISSPLMNQFPVLKTRMYPLGRRRCSAPEAVLRREAEAFALTKTAKDGRNNSQKKSIKHKKKNGVQAKLYENREHEVKQRMRHAMQKHLEDMTEYSPEICSQLNSTISEEISEYLQCTHRAASEDRKRFVCSVYIGAVKDDGIHAAVRCMWSPREDRVVVADYQNDSLYAMAVVFTAA